MVSMVLTETLLQSVIITMTMFSSATREGGEVEGEGVREMGGVAVVEVTEAVMEGETASASFAFEAKRR